MKKLLWATPVFIALAVLLTVIVKFNFIGAPFVGDPVIYAAADTGETMEVHLKADNSVSVRLFEIEGVYMKGFEAKPIRSASGAKYQSGDKRFIFLSKGDEVSVFHRDELIFSGVKIHTIEQESLYYSEVFGRWRDDIGDCVMCTPENGFGADGVVDDVAWRELWLSLKNDANERPSIEDVTTFFENQYAANPARYPVHVSVLKGTHIVYVAVPKKLKNMNFFDPRGALLASYDVIEHRWGDGPATLIRYPLSMAVDNLEVAIAFAEQSETYSQDGHNLRLREPQHLHCSACYDFVFDHYGAPDVPHYVSVRVNGDGTVDDITMDDVSE